MINCTFTTPQGKFNYRVGAIIIKDNKILMAKNATANYYYSVGGRVAFDETSQQAVVRECKEELGITLEVDKLLFIHENFFTEKFHYHEISLYFLMKQSDKLDNITTRSKSLDSNVEEQFDWLDIDKLKNIHLFPAFFKTELKNLPNEVKHIIETESDQA